MTPEEIKNLDRLIAELEKIQAEIEKYQKLIAGNSQAQIDWVDVTARRCADLVEKSKSLAWGSNMNDLLQDVADAIRKEFKL